MKKITNLFSVLMIAMLAVALSFSACSDDDEDDNGNGNGDDNGIESTGTVTVGGIDSTYSLSQGVLQYNAELEGGVQVYTLILGSSGLDWTTYSGIGEVLWLQIYSEQNPLTDGTFTVDSDSTTVQVNTIDSAASYFAVRAEPQTSSSLVSYKFVSGQGDETTLSKDGEVYEVNATFPVAFKSTDSTLTNISVTYSGELNYEEGK